MNKKWVAIALLFPLVAACATPMASRPIVMQGPGFDPHHYAIAQATCRNMIEYQLSSDDQASNAAGSALLGALLGAALGAAMGGSIGQAGLGATMGTIGGAAGGLGSAGKSAQSRQNVYNAAMAGCLNEKGYRVLGIGQ